MTAVATEEDVRGRVNRFYETLPFNVQQSPADAARTIRAGNAIRTQYPALHSLLQRRRGQRVLEVGCGGGWFANSVAHHYGAQIEAIDLCDHALGFARDVGVALGAQNPVEFRKRDIFTLKPEDFDGGFDIVNSLGVLHHTHDCHQALQCVLPLVRPGGFLHLGLYHLHGRLPFLEMFSDLRGRLGADDTSDEYARLEADAFARYCALYPKHVTDQTLLRSWFRDQVIHPHETQHTVREAHDWLTAAGFECMSTSVTNFEPVGDWNQVFEFERSLAEVSYRKNVVEQTYYPGFFVIVARRPSD